MWRLIELIVLSGFVIACLFAASPISLSPVLAKDVFIEVPLQGARFSDNFFDLLPGERKTILITSPQIKKGEELPLTVKHIRETYN